MAEKLGVRPSHPLPSPPYGVPQLPCHLGLACCCRGNQRDKLSIKETEESMFQWACSSYQRLRQPSFSPTHVWGWDVGGHNSRPVRGETCGSSKFYTLPARTPPPKKKLKLLPPKYNVPRGHPCSVAIPRSAVGFYFGTWNGGGAFSEVGHCLQQAALT